MANSDIKPKEIIPASELFEKLRPKEKKFATAFLCGKKACDAAREAGYSKRNASRIGYKTRVRPRVKAYIEAVQAEEAAKFEVEIERIVSEEVCIAYLDPREIFDESGDLKRIDELPERVARAISSLTVREITQKDGTVIVKREVRFNDKGAALKRLGTYKGMYSEGHFSGTIVINADTSITKTTDSGLSNQAPLRLIPGKKRQSNG